jgi:uncharacterized protein (TIGR00106 family)
MLAEFTIVPTGKGESLSKYVAESLDLIDKSGIRYTLTPMGTIVEGEWDEILSLVKKCHDNMRKHANRVITTIKIDDREGAVNRLEGKVRSVEEALDRKLK